MVTPRKRPLVLVVEDDPALGDVMLTALKDDGLDAKLAHDGDEAMRDVDDLSPSVMVLDLMMPKRDGFSVLRELRADGRISHLPVIVVTAIFGMSERLYATELGAADYVTKPFELDDLISRVRALLSPAIRVIRFAHGAWRVPGAPAARAHPAHRSHPPRSIALAQT